MIVKFSYKPDFYGCRAFNKCLITRHASSTIKYLFENRTIRVPQADQNRSDKMQISYRVN